MYETQSIVYISNIFIFYSISLGAKNSRIEQANN